jgi:maltose O-acetyltransferase
MRIKTIINRFRFHLVNHLLAGTDRYALKRKLLMKTGVKIGRGTKIVGPFYCSGDLTIGEDCWIGRDFTVHGNGSVVIGDRCDFGPEVALLTGGHEIGDRERRAGTGVSYKITIGNGVWVGARATIYNNINIGDSAVIAACACVREPVGNDTMVGGVPAKPIMELSHEDTRLSAE